MTEDIDYKTLFEKLQRENEGLRINIVKLKNDEIPFFEQIKGKFADIVEHEHFPIMLYGGIMVFIAIIMPFMRFVFKFFFRRKESEG